jgi:CelD/BcsL family acetyltransferase involved in cellulose biosynthesis
MPLSTKTNDFQRLSQHWQDLLKESTRNWVFLTPTWQRAWWERLGEGQELMLVSFREGERLMGVAPLMRKGEVLSLIGDKDVCDYLDVVTARGKEDEVCKALLAFLEAVDWRVLDLVPLRPDSIVVTHLVPMLRARGYGVEDEQIDVSPEMSLPASWDEFVDGLGKKGRHELRRKLRRLERYGEVHYDRVKNGTSLHQEMDDFLKLFKESMADKIAFLTPEREAFFRSLAAGLMERGWLSLAFLDVNGRRVATTLSFDYDNSFSLYNSGYDPAYSSLAVGLLHKALCIKHAIESGKTRFDFLRGAEPYKYDLGGKDVPIYRFVVRRQA